jgi:excisionase family DNA binding protein
MDVSVDRNLNVRMSNLMTETEVANWLNVRLSSVRRWRLERRGPAFMKVGALVRYRPEDLDGWLNALPTGGSNHSFRSAIWKQLVVDFFVRFTPVSLPSISEYVNRGSGAEYHTSDSWPQ